MITEKFSAVEKSDGAIPAGSFGVKVHVRKAKRGDPEEDYHFSNTRGAVIKSGNLWQIRSRDPRKFDVDVDLVKKTIDIRVKIKDGDHREWLLPLVDQQKRWVVFHDASQLFIEWHINAEMGEAYNIMKDSYIAARA